MGIQNCVINLSLSRNKSLRRNTNTRENVMSVKYYLKNDISNCHTVRTWNINYFSSLPSFDMYPLRFIGLLFIITSITIAIIQMYQRTLAYRIFIFFILPTTHKIRGKINNF